MPFILVFHQSKSISAIKRMYSEVIALLQYNYHDGVIHACVYCLINLLFHQSKCISAIKLYTLLPPYISLSSFMYLCVPCYSDACLKSSALRVGMKTLHNTIQSSLFYYLHLCILEFIHVFVCSLSLRCRPMLKASRVACGSEDVIQNKLQILALSENIIWF